jgi:hypothetical protein
MFTIDEANLDWLRRQAPNPHGISAVVDSLLQKARTGKDPIVTRLDEILARLDQLEQAA